MMRASADRRWSHRWADRAGYLRWNLKLVGDWQSTSRTDDITIGVLERAIVCEEKDGKATMKESED